MKISQVLWAEHLTLSQQGGQIMHTTLLHITIGQLISKQNHQAITSSKKRTKCTQDTELPLDNFVSGSTDL